MQNLNNNGDASARQPVIAKHYMKMGGKVTVCLQLYLAQHKPGRRLETPLKNHSETHPLENTLSCVTFVSR